MSTFFQWKAGTLVLLSFHFVLVSPLFQLPAQSKNKRLAVLLSTSISVGWVNNSNFIKNEVLGTFCVSLEARLTFEPKTSFPWDCREVFSELDPTECCPLPLATAGSLSLDPCKGTGPGWGFKGFPSKRLPTPVKGLNFGSVSAGSSSTAGIKVAVWIIKQKRINRWGLSTCKSKSPIIIRFKNSMQQYKISVLPIAKLIKTWPGTSISALVSKGNGHFPGECPITYVYALDQAHGL